MIALIEGGPETTSKPTGKIMTPDVESWAIEWPLAKGTSVRANGRMVAPIWPTGGVWRDCTVDGDSAVRTGRIEVSCFKTKRWTVPFRTPDGVVLRMPAPLMVA